MKGPTGNPCSSFIDLTDRVLPRSDILLNGRTQLHAFRDAIVKCRTKATAEVLHRLSDEKRRS